MPKTIVILGPPGTGKCVDPETYILTSSGIKKIGSLVDEFPGPDKTVTLEDLKVYGIRGLAHAREFYDSGIRSTVKITTEAGFELIGSLSHPVLGMRGGDVIWIRLGDIQKGDRIAVQSGARLFPQTNPRLPTSSPYCRAKGETPIKYQHEVSIPEFMSETLAEWLGWFLGEGCFGESKENQCPTFCNFSKQVISRMSFLTKDLFGLNLCPNDEHNFRIPSIRLKRWLSDIGADGLSAKKSVPPSILCSTENCQRAFIRAIFEAEASVSIPRRCVEFSTASSEMCRQLQLMLLNFGVTARKSFKWAMTQRWGQRKYYRLTFYGRDLVAFKNRLGFMVGSEKQSKLESIGQAGKGWDLHGLPVDFVSRRFRAIREKMRLNKDRRSRAYWRDIKCALRAMTGTRNEGQRLVSRELVEKVLSGLSVYSCDRNYEELLSEVNSERLWDVVKDKVNSGDRHVVDLTVPEGSSFVGNGLVCHNTSSAVTVAEGWFENGAAPDEVAYLAFTRAAAREAAKRIMKGELPKEWGEKLPHFRTIHSLAFRGLHQAYEDLRVINDSDMKNFAKWSSFEGDYAVTPSEDLSEIYLNLERRGRKDGEKCLTAYTLSRIMARTAEDFEVAKLQYPDIATEATGFIEEGAYREFVMKYEAYKQANGLVDFTDMLKYALLEMPPLEDVGHLVVDELQDNAPILFSICDRLFPNAEAWLCGDPNQSIYRFAGAAPALFMERARMADHRILLRHTHRFGQEIVDFSKQIIERARDGVVVDIRGVSGRHHRIRMTGEFQPTVSEMLILHRHVMGCQALAQAYIMAGMPFRNERGHDPLGYELRIKGFHTLYSLAGGETVISGAVSRLIEDLMPSMLPSAENQKATRLVVHGAKKRLQDGYLKGDVSLTDLVKAKILTEAGADVVRSRDYRVFKHADDLEYYHRVTENGYALEPYGQIPTITTIHGSKGRQSPEVKIFAETGPRCFNDMDSEHRLAYVAATRTQGDLEICAEHTVDWASIPYNYPVPEAKHEII